MDLKKVSNIVGGTVKNAAGTVQKTAGKAKEVAEQLGEGWWVMDMSLEEAERTRKFLSAIFSPSEDE